MCSHYGKVVCMKCCENWQTQKPSKLIKEKIQASKMILSSVYHCQSLTVRSTCTVAKQFVQNYSFLQKRYEITLHISPRCSITYLPAEVSSQFMSPNKALHSKLSPADQKLSIL